MSDQEERGRERECAAMGHTGSRCEHRAKLTRETVRRWLDRAGDLYDEASQVLERDYYPDLEWERITGEADRWLEWGQRLHVLLMEHEARVTEDAVFKLKAAPVS